MIDKKGDCVMSRIKLKDKVRIIVALPMADQTEIDLAEYIGRECEVIGHWNQTDSDHLEKGEIQVVLKGEGIIHLNSGEYEIVS